MITCIKIKQQDGWGVTPMKKRAMTFYCDGRYSYTEHYKSGNNTIHQAISGRMSLEETKKAIQIFETAIPRLSEKVEWTYEIFPVKISYQESGKAMRHFEIANTTAELKDLVALLKDTTKIVRLSRLIGEE